MKKKNKKTSGGSQNTIKRIAREIVALEKEIRQGKNVKENQNKIEEIMSALTIEEALALDDYIYSENLLTN